MKFCEKCSDEIGTKDGENLCAKCEDAAARGKKLAGAAKRRRDRESVMRDLGMVKVRGSMGGVYWE